MASRSLHIANFADAVCDGTIPGRFNAARTVFAFPTLESPTQRGGASVWTVSVRALGPGGAPVPIREAWLAPRAPAPAGVVGEISTESFNVTAAGVRGAARRGGVPTVVAEGKNLGKANATNAVTQALRNALTLYNGRLRKSAGRRGADADGMGAGADGTDGADGMGAGADADGTGADGKGAPAPRGKSDGAAPRRPPPMLVKKFGETRAATLGPADFERGVTLQPKLNGVRLVAVLAGSGENGSGEDGSGENGSGENVLLYSRTSEDYPGQASIRGEAARLLARAPGGFPELAGAAPHLDGELYSHGKSLNWISGQARRGDDDDSLEYHVFDVFFPARPEVPSRRRQAYLDALFAADAADAAGPPLRHIRRVPGEPARSEEQMRARVDEFVAQGYEGGIARKDWEPYQYGTNNYHSAHLVKVKPIFHEEFPVVGFAQGTRGKDVGAVIWVCEVPAPDRKSAGDFRFNVVPKDMSYGQRYAIFKCLDEDRKAGAAGESLFDRLVRGQPLTVEFPERSAKTGKPSQAKALAFRTYEGGPDRDPIARLMRECGATEE